MDSTMSDSQTFKVAFIGSHGVGKTTLCYGLAAGLKSRDVNLEVVREVARRSPLPINQVTSVASQAWILHTQIAEELAADADSGVIICDRSVLDNYVYMLVAAGPQEPLEPLVDHWMTTYDLLLHVPIVAAPSADGVRALDPAFQRAIDQRLLTELKRRQLPVEYLDAQKRGDWLDTSVAIVLDRLEPPQLQLL